MKIIINLKAFKKRCFKIWKANTKAYIINLFGIGIIIADKKYNLYK